MGKTFVPEISPHEKPKEGRVRREPREKTIWTAEDLQNLIEEIENDKDGND